VHFWLVFSLAPNATRVPNNVVTLVRDGWQTLPSSMAAAQPTPFDADAQCNYRWNNSVETLDLVSIRSTPDLNAVLESMYREGVGRASSDGLMEMLQTLMDLTGDREFSALDRLLLEADPARLAPEYLVGLLRATANYAMSIPSWSQFRDKVRSQLTKRGLPASEIMVGLE
jgi:hypothetical protein